MERPCFLVLDHDFPGSISTRKLVIETAKYNVITTYSAAEAIETLRRFPKVNAVVLNAEIDSVPCDEILKRLREIAPKMVFVVTSGGGHKQCDHADYVVDGFDPKMLLATLQKLLAKQEQEVSM